MQDVVIVAATRTPIGCFHGALAPLSAVDLGAATIRSLLEKTALAAEQIDEVIFWSGPDRRKRTKPGTTIGAQSRVKPQYTRRYHQPGMWFRSESRTPGSAGDPLR